tara:strand:+ start:84 stop:4415 length:4332 start_codon:yes stop_codon:yes gene_type:complete
MESHRRIGGYRALLPYEVKLCESIGITDKEYFEFLDLVEAKPVEADIVMMPQTLVAMGLATGGPGTGAAFALNFWGQLAVSIALATATYLLTPKPKDPGQAPRLTIGGVQGRSRFNPTHGFESLQDLASLGSFIPLVYARQGVRASSQLLWSQVRTTQYGETINAIVLFSNGEIGAKPKFESLALGENFLADLPLSKQKVYFSRGARTDGRLQGVSDTETPSSSHDQYQEGSSKNANNYAYRGNREYDDSDPFMVKLYQNNSFVYKPSFSSTKTPSTNNTFGVYAPMPNGNAYKVNWELLLLAKDGDDNVKRDARYKMGKLYHKYPRYVGITNHGSSPTHSSAGNGVVLTPDQVVPGSLIVNYRIYHALEETAWIDASITDVDPTKKWNKFSPWGSADAKGVVDTTRENVDDAMALGEQYMVGSTLMTVTSEDNGNRWISGSQGFQKAIQLEADEPGYLEFRNTDETRLPYESLVVQKVELATFSNTRKCDITEIGIKSMVWRQINGFPNVNEMPNQDRIRSYENKNGSIQLGSISKYVKRLSFFKLQAKKINSTDKFVDVSSIAICVKGSSPVAQYNAITIKSINGPSQYEFRFLPVAGNVILNNYDKGYVHVLNYSAQVRKTTNYNLGLQISYHAQVEFLPTDLTIGNSFTNNPEWDRGGLGQKFADDGTTVLPITGPVESFQPVNDNSACPVDEDLVWQYTSGQFSPPNRCTYFGNGVNQTGGQSSWHTNVTNYNYKGTPTPDQARYGTPNAYFSPEKGIALTSVRLGNGWTRWHFLFGGTLVPISFFKDYRDNYKPYNDGDWTPHLEEVDQNGNGTGRYHRFRLARNPASWGGGEDWRGAARDANNNAIPGRNLYAIAVQQSNKKPDITTTVNVRTTTATKGSGSGLTVIVEKKTNGTQTCRDYSVAAPGTGYEDNDTVTIDGESPSQTLTVTIVPPVIEAPEEDTHSDWRDDGGDGTATFYTNYWSMVRHNPNNAIADYFLFDSESSSHENGPEHELTYINEIVNEGDSANPQINYEKLAIAGIRIGATNTLSSFNSFSAYIQEGIKVDRLVTDANVGIPNRNARIDYESSDNFVEIAHDLLTNTDYGSGDIVGHDGVDRARMIEGAKYCRANGFFWNGVIDSKFNLREFIFEHAGYNFLDFSILGGRFSLRPSFPINDDHTINYNATIDNKGIDIKALFTDGNMKDIKVTFLTPEERKMFKATVIYRDDQRNSQGIGGFPENIAKTYAYNPIRADGTVEDTSSFYPKAEKLPEEVFDLSNWCTSETHAKTFAAIALSIRKEVDHGIVFQTPPSSVFGLIAGDYIRVLTEATHTSRFNNGSIDSEGVVISRSAISGSINTYCWTPGTLDGIEKKEFSVGSDGKNSLGLVNKLFAQVDTTEEDRIYKVESITYGEEGFIQIAASHVPLINDKLAVLHHASPDKINSIDFDSRFPELRGL